MDKKAQQPYYMDPQEVQRMLLAQMLQEYYQQQVPMTAPTETAPAPAPPPAEPKPEALRPQLQAMESGIEGVGRGSSAVSPDVIPRKQASEKIALEAGDIGAAGFGALAGHHLGQQWRPGAAAGIGAVSGLAAMHGLRGLMRKKEVPPRPDFGTTTGLMPRTLNPEQQAWVDYVQSLPTEEALALSRPYQPPKQASIQFVKQAFYNLGAEDVLHFTSLRG